MSKLPDLEGLAIFAKVVEMRSFVGAASELGLSKATVSKAISRVEARLGTRLFNRTSRRFALTDAGKMLAERAAQLLADGEAIDLGGGRRVRWLDTPHIPHGWDAGVLYEEASGTLLCGDLFTQLGDGPALTEADVVGPAVAAEDLFGFSSLNPGMGAIIRRLADLSPRTLALMHGPSFAGDGAAALRALADDYDRRVRAALA